MSASNLSSNTGRIHFTGTMVLTFVGIMLVATNLRPALTSVAPVLTQLGQDLGLDSVGQGILTTLPVLCLGLAAPLAPRMARRFGAEKSVLWALIVLAIAMGLRPYIGLVGLFIGTIIAGGCIGISGVLLPGLVKRDFPGRVGLMTGLYTMFLNIGASIAAGATEPLRLFFRGAWSPALAFWLVPAVLASLVWGVHILHRRGATVSSRAQRHISSQLYKDGLAWQVTIFMGAQSSLAYIIFGWLPTILAERGMGSVEAGLALSTSILIQVITAVLIPAIAEKMRHQSGAIVGVLIFTLAGYAGCLYAPVSSAWFWIVILGLGQGGSFALALTLLALRAPNPETASELSAMAQGIGYIVAACGPLIVGFIHASFGNWAAIGPFIAAVGFISIGFGIKAGRNKLVAGHQ